ncbi:MAG: hypothetical protein Tsb0016_06440 [Sphingomonadales bacterium]
MIAAKARADMQAARQSQAWPGTAPEPPVGICTGLAPSLVHKIAVAQGAGPLPWGVTQQTMLNRILAAMAASAHCPKLFRYCRNHCMALA